MRPSDDIFEWAEDAQDAFGNPTKTEPPAENQQTGLIVGQPWPRLWHNYALNNISNYLKHLADDPVGTVKISVTQVLDPTAQWGGTWSEESGVSLGTKTVYTYEKTGV